MRIMGIDFGDRRSGIAISDMSATLAGESFIIDEPNPVHAAEKIIRLICERAIDEVVLGFPKNMDGSIGERGLKSETFAALLRERTGIPVILWDERRTTIDAHRILTETGNRGKKRKDKVDAVAATLILQGYLDYRAR